MVVDRFLANAVRHRSSELARSRHLIRRHAVVPHQGLDAARPLHRVVAPGGVSVPVGLWSGDDAAAATATGAAAPLRVLPAGGGLFVTGRLVIVSVQQILETGRAPESLYRRAALVRLAQSEVKVFALELVDDPRPVLQLLGAVALRVLAGGATRGRDARQIPRGFQAAGAGRLLAASPGQNGANLVALRRRVVLAALVHPRSQRLTLLVLLADVLGQFPFRRKVREFSRRTVHDILRVRAERQIRLETHVVRDWRGKIGGRCRHRCTAGGGGATGRQPSRVVGGRGGEQRGVLAGRRRACRAKCAGDRVMFLSRRCVRLAVGRRRARRRYRRRAYHRAAQLDARAVVREDLALLTAPLYQVALPLRHVAAAVRLVAGVAAGGSHVGRALLVALPLSTARPFLPSSLSLSLPLARFLASRGFLAARSAADAPRSYAYFPTARSHHLFILSYSAILTGDESYRSHTTIGGRSITADTPNIRSSTRANTHGFRG